MIPAAGPSALRPPASPAPGPGRPAPLQFAGDRQVLAELHPRPESAADARALVRDPLRRWDLGRLADDAEAIAAELAANAIAVARRPPDASYPAIILGLRDRPPELRIYVWDNGPGQPRKAAAAHDDEVGRGLAIVEALSSAWGWYLTPQSGGKAAWATVLTTP